MQRAGAGSCSRRRTPEPQVILHVARIVLFILPMNHSPASYHFWFYGYPKALAEAWART